MLSVFRYNWRTFCEYPQVKEGGEIIAGECNCIAGKGGRCKHTSALVNYVNNHEDQSVTSGPCQWNIPRRVKDYSRGALIADLFPKKPLDVPMKTNSFMDLESCYLDVECPLFEIARVRKDLSATESFLDGKILTWLRMNCA